MNVVVFIRHGQSTANVRHTLTSDVNGYALTDEGRSQAERIARTIPKALKIDGFYTSPILRAVQTAEAISKQIGIKPQVDERLRERRMGALNDVVFSSQEELHNAMMAEIKSGCKKGLETWEHMQERMRSLTVGTKGVTIAVTHHDPILSALGMIDKSYDDFYFLHEITNASATAIDFEGPRIICVGSHAVPDLP